MSTHSKDLVSEFIPMYAEQKLVNPTQSDNSTDGLMIPLSHWQLPDSASHLSAASVDSNILAMQKHPFVLYLGESLYSRYRENPSTFVFSHFQLLSVSSE